MKTVIRQILKAAKARVQKATTPTGSKNPSYKLNPAPAYWLLAPVHPSEIVKAKMKQQQTRHRDM
jgi:hypothetical protein